MTLLEIRLLAVFGLLGTAVLTTTAALMGERLFAWTKARLANGARARVVAPPAPALRRP